MVHFVSHCRVSNGTYYQSQSPSAFPQPDYFQAPPLLLHIQVATVVVPSVGPQELRWRVCTSHLAIIPTGLGPADITYVFFVVGCSLRTFFITVFPWEQYPVRNTVFLWRFSYPSPKSVSSSDSVEQVLYLTFQVPHPYFAEVGTQQLPPTHWLLWFRCPVCGIYSHACGFTPLSPPGVHPVAILVSPLELPACPRCSMDQSRCFSTSPSVCLDAPLGSPIWATAYGNWQTLYPLPSLC
jgi:hypothetical protein